MKSLLTASLLVLALLAVGSTSALRVSQKMSGLQQEAAEFSQLSMEQYLHRLEEALRHAPENQELLQHIHYYRAVARNTERPVTQTVRDEQKGTVHDCIAFELQPALFTASAEEIRDARANWLSATMGGLSSSEAVCHPGTVAIPRPVVKFAGGAVPKLSTPPQKKAPKNKTRDPIPAGYSYVDSTFANCTSGTNFTYTILGMGKAVNSSIPSTPFLNDADHSINQMWWVYQNKMTGSLDTLEAGWIHSSYWSFFPETMLFVFSTPNGYSGPGNKYNFAGGFIGYPGAPALQQGVQQVMYMWKYEILYSPTNGSVTGFAMKLTPFTVGANGQYEFGTEIPLGYYPVARYENGMPPNFNVLQTGQELSENQNSTSLKAGGKIFGWGTNVERFKVFGNFTNFGQKASFNYGTTPGFAQGSSPYPADHWVAFHGDDCGSHC